MWQHNRKLQAEWDGAVVNIEIKAEIFDDESPDSDMCKEYADFVAKLHDDFNEFEERMQSLFPFEEEEEADKTA